MRLLLVLTPLLMGSMSCATSSYSSESTYRLVERTLQDLQERVALSEQRVYVAPFFPADREGEQEMRIMDGEMSTQHRNTARLLRHEVLGYLAPRMYVLDLPDTGDVSGVSPEERIYDLAEEAGATVILFGRYSMESSKIRIMLRAVEVETRTILVAQDGLVGHVALHGHERETRMHDM
jgi:hypothetical protein